MALIVISVLTITLAGYLAWSRTHVTTMMRSQMWGAALPLAEAGIEEAMAHLNATNKRGANGWAFEGGLYTRTRTLSDGYYVVSIDTNSRPIIVSTGFIPASGASNFISRTVRVTTKKEDSGKAILVRNRIDLGSDFRIDSFDSTDPNFSTLRKYDPLKRKDNADLATLSSAMNAIELADSDVYGRISTGPGGGGVVYGSHGAAGSIGWVDGTATGIQPGWFSDDMTTPIPDVATPPGLPYTRAPAGSTVIGGITYTYVLGNGNYEMYGTLRGSIYVTGDAVLYVPASGRIQFGSEDRITIAPGGKLRLYNASTTDAVMKDMVNDSGDTSRLIYYGLPTTAGSKCTFTGTGQFCGQVIAPNQDMVLSGGSAVDQDFVGSIVANNVTMSGHFYFHYDESLGGKSGGLFSVATWNEWSTW